MKRCVKSATPLLLCLAALTACDRAVQPDRQPAKADDPAVSAALHDPIMSDPDLSGQDLGMVGVIATDSDVPAASTTSGAVNTR